MNRWPVSAKRSLLALPVVAALAACTSTPNIPGDGNVTSVVRPIEKFTRVASDAPVVLVFSDAPGAELRVVADSNFQEAVKTSMSGELLMVGFDCNCVANASKPIEVHIPSQSVNEVTLTKLARARWIGQAPVGLVVNALDRSLVQFEELKADALTVNAAGSAMVRGSGEARALNLDLEDSAAAEIKDVRLGDATIRGEDETRASLNAKGAVDVALEDVSRVTLLSKPEKITSDVEKSATLILQ